MREEDAHEGVTVVCVNAKDNRWGKLTLGKEYTIREALRTKIRNYENLYITSDDGSSWWYDLDRFELAGKGDGWESP